MVRLEKIFYEQLVNTRQFKRERIMGRPQKWYNEPRTPAFRVASIKLCAEGLSGYLYRIIEPLLAKFGYQWGLAMEDMILFQDRELRRDPLFEHIQRESFHPMTWLMFNYRRMRYYKTERGVRGTYAPDWLRKEAEERTLAESVENKDEWDNFVYTHYMSDMTPTVRPSVLQKLIIFEFITIYGILRLDAWDRYFYNEVFYAGTNYTRKELSKIPNPFPNLNLQTEDGRRKFELEVARFIQLYPGSVTRQGEKFDFDRFYALEALRNNRDLTRYDPEQIKSLRVRIEEEKFLPKEDKKLKSKKSGISLPGFLQPDQGRGIFTS